MNPSLPLTEHLLWHHLNPQNFFSTIKCGIYTLTSASENYRKTKRSKDSMTQVGHIDKNLQAYMSENSLMYNKQIFKCTVGCINNYNYMRLLKI